MPGRRNNDSIDQLLIKLRSLEDKIVAIKDSDALPFSFFSDSFDKIEQISRLIHQMQLRQIDEMKQQMERLVLFLSEREQTLNGGEPDAAPEMEKTDKIDAPVVEPPRDPLSEGEPPGNRAAEGLTLPEYRNPRKRTQRSQPLQQEPLISEENREGKSGVPSLNDRMKAPPALLDLKRGISLNDRFYYQRELFHNSREEMNHVMEQLNSMESYQQVEAFLKENRSWTFDDPVVKEFLTIIKKGFE